MSTPPVFLIDQLPDAEHAELDGPEGHHAAVVRRLGPGAELTLTDGRGTAARCVVDAVTGKQTLRLRLLHRWHDPPPAPRVVLAQALIKGDRGELAVELATEAGADVLIPWRARHCVARWDDGPRGAKALARWRKTAREAAKQARRTRVPDITEPIDTAALADRIRGGTTGATGPPGAAVLLDADAPTGLTGLALPHAGDLLLIVGPEGGISESEYDTLVSAGAQVARLGPTVLRASTAGAAAIAAAGVLTPRWR